MKNNSSIDNNEIFEEAVTEMLQISIDFCENYGMSISQFNGMMLAQMTRLYNESDALDDFKNILTAVLDKVNDTESLYLSKDWDDEDIQ